MADTDLSALRVHPIHNEQDVALWDKHMSQFHPQGWQGMVGEQIRYVAVREDGCWVACLGWSAAAFRLSPREDWIDWSPVQMRQRRHLIANNSRFLILPGHEQVNIGSRILGLNIRRLSADWQEVYDHPIWVVETFVEQDRLGSCYKASGWVERGVTKGFRRVSRGGYRKHGIAKRYFSKEIIRGAVKKLHGRKELLEDYPLCGIEPQVQHIQGSDAGEHASNEQPSLLALIESLVTDHRKARGQRYSVKTVLGLIILGILAGKKNIAEITEWAKELPQLTRERLGCRYVGARGRPTPSANTYRYILQDVGTEQIENILLAWCKISGINTQNTHIAIDGKLLRGSRRGDQQAVAQVNAYDVRTRMPVDHIVVPHTTTETTAIRDLINRNDFKNSIVTADAAHTNAATADAIHKKRGSFLYRLKAINLRFSSS